MHFQMQNESLKTLQKPPKVMDQVNMHQKLYSRGGNTFFSFFRRIVPCQNTIRWAVAIAENPFLLLPPKCWDPLAAHAEVVAAHAQAQLTPFWMGHCPMEQIRAHYTFPFHGETLTGK